MNALPARIFVLLTTISASAVAQDNAPGAAYLATVEEILNQDVKFASAKLLANVVSDRSRFLDINYIEADDPDEKGGWNVAYDLDYTYVADDGFSTSSGTALLNTLEAKLDISGSYSFDSAVNNKDLSAAKVSIAYVYGNFGPVQDIDRTQSVSYQLCRGKMLTPKLSEFNSEEAFSQAITTYEKSADRCIAQAGVDKLFDSSAAAYGYEVALHAGREGNQDYSDSHDLYGGSAIVSARRWPSLRVDMERVDASADEQRVLLTDDYTYDRVTLELGYQHSFSMVRNLPITLSLGYRQFLELDAPREIEAADQDQFDYWSVSLRVSARMFSFIKSDDYSLYVRFTDGQLPFDLQPDSAIELGFSSNIALLAKLFQ